MAQYQILVNPVSSRGMGERSIPLIEAELNALGLDYRLQRTERPWHAAELACQAARQGIPVVVATGGDGTANEVLNGLMQARQEGFNGSALGVIGVGRGNDFAFSMGLPAGISAGCRALASGQRRKIDIGKVSGGDYPEGRYFGNGVGIGFDAVVGFEAAKMKWLSGFPSYIIAALKTIFLYYHAPTLEICPGEEKIIQPSLMVSIMNGRRMGGGFMMAPQGKPDDGLLDLCLAGQVSRARIFPLIPHFLNGTQFTQKPIQFRQANKVVVTALSGSLPAHADGETLCTHGKTLSIELLPAQLDLISPLTGIGVS